MLFLYAPQMKSAVSIAPTAAVKVSTTAFWEGRFFRVTVCSDVSELFAQFSGDMVFSQWFGRAMALIIAAALLAVSLVLTKPLKRLEAATKQIAGGATSDIGPLANLTNLETLELEFNLSTEVYETIYVANPIEPDKVGYHLYDISALSCLTNLKELKLGYVSAYFECREDIEVLKSLTNLETLSITGRPSGWNFLADLPNLTDLILGPSQYDDISFISNLPNLTTLDLGDVRTGDLSPVSELKRLTTIIVPSEYGGDISPLFSLPDFTSVIWEGRERGL